MKRVLVGLGVKEMIICEVEGARGANARALALAPASASVRPRVQIEIVAPDARVEPIVQALLARSESAANG